MNKKVKVYYNDVFVSTKNVNEAYEVYAECPFVEMNVEDAEEFAEFNLQSGIWDAYLIPSILPKTSRVIYHKKNRYESAD